MAKYVVLVNWTEQGVGDAKQTVQRAESIRQLAEQLGGKQDLLLWTLGRYDIVGVYDMPDDQAITTLALRAAGLGTVRTETLRAFTAEEMGQILGKLG